MRSAARGKLIRTHDTVNEDVLADADDVTLAAVDDTIVAVGDAARERGGLNGAGPDRKPGDACARGILGGLGGQKQVLPRRRSLPEPEHAAPAAFRSAAVERAARALRRQAYSRAPTV